VNGEVIRRFPKLLEHFNDASGQYYKVSILSSKWDRIHRYFIYLLDEVKNTGSDPLKIFQDNNNAPIRTLVKFQIHVCLIIIVISTIA